jgi:hypothetical protein
MATDFRDFLYLDRALVRSFLAQIEGGEYDEVTERQKTTGKGGIGGRLGSKCSPMSAAGASTDCLGTAA